MLITFVNIFIPNRLIASVDSVDPHLVLVDPCGIVFHTSTMVFKLAFFAFACLGSCQISTLVDTFIGTGGLGYGVGGSPPGAQVPFGAMRLSPDTSHGPAWFFFDEFGGYHYSDTSIRVFSHTHMVGSGASDFGNHGLIVTRWWNNTVFENSAHDAAYRSRFSKESEAAMPGFYTAYLEDAETRAEVVAVSTHSGIHRCDSCLRVPYAM